MTSVRLTHRRFAVAATVVLALALSFAVWAAGKTKPPAAADEEAEPTPASKGDTVHIYLQTVPPRKAAVRWGNKSLGTIPAPKPMVIERQRDSGPLDLVIRAAGFLPVHTRAYTFSDSRVSVKLTPPSEKSKLFGYKQEPAPNPDGGPPPDPASPGPPALAPAAPPPAAPPPAAPAPVPAAPAPPTP
jgi:hypothetical protein